MKAVYKSKVKRDGKTVEKIVIRENGSERIVEFIDGEKVRDELTLSEEASEKYRKAQDDLKKIKEEERKVELEAQKETVAQAEAEAEYCGANDCSCCFDECEEEECCGCQCGTCGGCTEYPGTVLVRFFIDEDRYCVGQKWFDSMQDPLFILPRIGDTLCIGNGNLTEEAIEYDIDGEEFLCVSDVQYEYPSGEGGWIMFDIILDYIEE